MFVGMVFWGVELPTCDFYSLIFRSAHCHQGRPITAPIVFMIQGEKSHYPRRACTKPVRIPAQKTISNSPRITQSATHHHRTFLAGLTRTIEPAIKSCRACRFEVKA